MGGRMWRVTRYCSAGRSSVPTSAAPHTATGSRGGAPTDKPTSQRACDEGLLDLVVQEGVFKAAELALEPPQVGLAHRLALLARDALHQLQPLLAGRAQQLHGPAALRTGRGGCSALLVVNRLHARGRPPGGTDRACSQPSSAPSSLAQALRGGLAQRGLHVLPVHLGQRHPTERQPAGEPLRGVHGPRFGAARGNRRKVLQQRWDRSTTP